MYARHQKDHRPAEHRAEREPEHQRRDDHAERAERQIASTPRMKEKSSW